MDQLRGDVAARAQTEIGSDMSSPPAADWKQWAWILPFAAALLYPWFLASFHAELAGAHRLTWLAWFWIACAYLVPAIGVGCAYRLGTCQRRSPVHVLGARLAHVVVAVPPLFTLMGVLLYLMKIEGHDGMVWAGLWSAMLVGGGLSMYAGSANSGVQSPLGDARRHARLRAVHGIAAVLLLGFFLLPHLFNHVVGVWGVEAHRATMKLLRHLYRNGVLEPLVISLFFFQILSGLVLFRRKSAAATDLIDTLQTASGIYLAVFIAGHINSVFTLARYFGTETDYAWAVGLPTGLLADAWNIRLVPHYSLAVFFLVAHLACAARLIMRKHGVAAGRSGALVWGVTAGGVVLSIVITAGMLGAR